MNIWKTVDKYVVAPSKIAWDKTYDFFTVDGNKEKPETVKEVNPQVIEKYNSEGDRICPQLSTIERSFVFFNEPTHIVDGIYLGSAYNAARQNTANKYDIGLVINVTRELSNYQNDVTYLHYPIYDNNNESIKEHLSDSFREIKKFQKSNNEKPNILIHCFMGASRSASIMIHYLMKEYNMNFDSAFSFVKGKRRTVNLTKSLASELIEVEYKDKLD